MPDRTTSIVLTGTNASALRALNETGAAAERNAKKTTDAYSKSTSKVGGLFKTLDSQLAQFGVPLTGALGAVGTKFDDAGKKSKGFGDKLSTLGGGIALGAAAGLALIGTSAVHAALEGEAAQARLDVAVKNTGANYADYSGRIDKLNGKMADFGFQNDDVSNSLSRLIPATHDVGKAIDLMGLAADIAAARGIDLTSATDLLTKVEQGRYTQLGKLGIASTAQIKGFKTTGEAVDFLTQKYKGSAAAAADTYSGKLKALGATVHNLEEDLGNKLLPIVSDGVGIILKASSAFGTANEATDGWLGKILLAGAAVPVAVFAVDKLGSGVSALAGAYGKAASAIGIGTTATEGATLAEGDLAIAKGASLTATEASAVSEARLVLSREALSAADVAVTTTSAQLTAALAAVAAAEEGDATAAAQLVAAADAATAAQSRLATASAAAATATEASATAAESAATFTASLGLVAGALAIPAAGLGFFLKMKADADSADKTVRKLADTLTHTGKEAADAQAKLGKIVGNAAAADLADYSNKLLANASAQELATTKAAALQHAIQDLPGTEAEHAAALRIATGEATKADLRFSDYARTTQTVSNAVQQATGALDDLKEKYGAAAVQSATLAAAQKNYGDLLASGTASENDLAVARQGVVSASEQNAATQDKVTAATQQGTDAANVNADATAKQAEADKAAAEATKKRADSLSKLAGVVGQTSTEIVDASKLGADAIDAIARSADDFNKNVDSAFSEAGDIVKGFADKTKISFAQVQTLMLKELGATENWATNLSKLADLGLNQGFLKKLAEAGPSSAGLVQTILDNVKKGSINSLNAMATAGDKAKANLKNHLDASVVDAATAVARWNNALAKVKHDVVTKLRIEEQGYADTVAKLRAITNLASLGQTAIVTFTGGGTGSGQGYHVRAEGGPVSRGGLYLVGEKGPEMFVPKQSGTILPHAATARVSGMAAAHGGDTYLTINATGIGDRELARSVVRALREANRTTGPLNIKIAG